MLNSRKSDIIILAAAAVLEVAEARQGDHLVLQVMKYPVLVLVVKILVDMMKGID